MKKYLIIVSLIVVVGFTGCSNSTPTCSDSTTKDLVIKIAKDELTKQGLSQLITQLNFEVENIRTTKHDKGVDTYQCAADFNMIGDKVETLPITYTVESTDDGNNFYVNVYGF